MGGSVRQPVVVIAGVMVMVQLVGCQSPGRYPGDGDAMSWAGRPAAPSLAFQPAAIQRRVDQLNEQLGPAWYETRNDVRLGVSAGYESSVVDQTHVLTYDRQSTNGDQVTDHFQRLRIGARSSTVVR